MNILNVLDARPPQKITASNAGNERLSSVSGLERQAAVAQCTDLTVSGQAKILSSLFEAASRYVEQEHVTPCTRHINGFTVPGSYINIEKYNDYLFDQAATTMVRQADQQGLVVEKSNVLAELRSVNPAIDSLKFDDLDRRQRLGANNVYSYLTLDDLDNFTSLYITAKEQGLSEAGVGGLACAKGVYKSCEGLWVEADHFPIGFPRNETDPEKIEAARFKLPQSRLDMGNEIRDKLQGDLGLGSGFLNYLLNPKIALGGQGESTLVFLSSLIDIQNQKDRSGS